MNKLHKQVVLVLAAILIALILGVIAVMSAGESRKFTPSEVAVGRDAEGLFFIACSKIDAVQVISGREPTNELAYKTALFADSGTNKVYVAEEKGYIREGSIESDSAQTFSITSFRVEGDRDPLVTFLTFSPSKIPLEMVVTGEDEIKNEEEWLSSCHSTS